MDKQAFPDFYRANMKRIYRYFLYRVDGHRMTAEDLTQDVFLKAFHAFESYDPAVSQSSWIYTIARNHLINHFEKRKPGVSLDAIEATIWGQDDWSDKMALRYDEGLLWKAIGSLDPDDARIIRLKYLEGWSYDEISEQQGKTAGALRVQAHRCLKLLAKLLKHSTDSAV